MRLVLGVLVLWPGLALAEDWLALDGAGITGALTARALTFADGTLQDFKADGRTLYGDQWGRWEVRGNRYCSTWPPSERWDCHTVDQNGLDIRFTDEAGATTIGRYVDLH